MKKYYETEILKFLNEGEYSPLFCSDFLHFLLSNRCDIHQIGDEIKYLEGLSTKTFTKKQTKFKKEPLKGLLHKHFFIAENIPKNCVDIFNKHKKNFIKRIEKNKQVTLRTFLNLFDKIGIESPYTGHLIIYKKINNKNYYLTLANHNESNEKIYERIKQYL